MSKDLLIVDLRGGLNDADPPLSLAETQCVDALNVDWFEGMLAHKRGGVLIIGLTFSSNGPFSGGILGLVRHVPGSDETVAELWAVDATGQICRLAGAATWTEPTLVDAVSTTAGALGLCGASLGGFLFLMYDSPQNRSHCWDVSLAKIRRTGLATPAAPTGATAGGSGLTFSRYYRQRYLDISGSDVRRKSEASASSSVVSITDDSGVTVTKAAALSEDETHWLVEYADAAAGPWYVASGNIAVGTTTYSDTAAVISTATPADEDGQYWPPPSAKFAIKANTRVVMGGNWETSGGYTTPKDNRVWWTPVIGASDIGDLERVPTGYHLDVDTAITGIGGPLNGIVYVFGYRETYALVPVGSGAEAFSRLTESTTIGCIQHRSIVMAEDELGNPALYFLSVKGPYRIGSRGLQYLGRDIESRWATVNLEAANTPCFGVYYAAKHQVWWWLPTVAAGSNLSNFKVVFDTQLGTTTTEGDVRYGWSRHTGTPSTVAYCAVAFSPTKGATADRALIPHTGSIISGTDPAIYKHDTGVDDDGSLIQGYVETKEYTPAGLGQLASVLDPVLVAEVSSGTTITVSAITDFGLATPSTGTVLLTATGSETHKIERVEGLQTANCKSVRFRIGDASANTKGWTLDALIVRVDGGQKI